MRLWIIFERERKTLSWYDLFGCVWRGKIDLWGSFDFNL